MVKLMGMQSYEVALFFFFFCIEALSEAVS